MGDSVISWPFSGRTKSENPFSSPNIQSLTLSTPTVVAGDSIPATHLALNHDLGTLQDFQVAGCGGGGGGPRAAYVAASPPPLPPRRRVSFPSTPHSLLLLAPPATIRPSPTKSAAVPSRA